MRNVKFMASWALKGTGATKGWGSLPYNEIVLNVRKLSI